MSLSPLEIAYCVVVLLLSYGLRGSTGFGGALGMPLLALVVPLKLLVPVWTVLGFASSVAILGKDRKHVSRGDFLAFIPWCLVGIAAGLYLFKTLDTTHLAQALGVVLMIYAGFSMWRIVRPAATVRVSPRIIGPVAGTLSGAVGTVFGTLGSVFFAIYLDARALPKDAFRATVSAMLLVLSVVRGLGYFFVGEFTRDAWILSAVAFPLMLAGIYIGDRIHVNLSERAFRWIVAVTLFLCGVPLLFKS
jgi:uncharacterized membrane protein YfcA